MRGHCPCCHRNVYVQESILGDCSPLCLACIAESADFDAEIPNDQRAKCPTPEREEYNSMAEVCATCYGKERKG